MLQSLIRMAALVHLAPSQHLLRGMVHSYGTRGFKHQLNRCYTYLKVRFDSTWGLVSAFAGSQLRTLHANILQLDALQNINHIEK